MRRGYFQVIGHPAELEQKNTFHMYCILYRGATPACSYSYQTVDVSHLNLNSDCAFAAAMMCITYSSLFVCPLCAFRCLPYSKNTCRNRRWSTWPVIGNPWFQPCSHPAASKRQMAGRHAGADAVRLCLLGSHFGLTSQKIKYGRAKQANKLSSPRWQAVEPICLPSKWSLTKLAEDQMSCEDWLRLCLHPACVRLAARFSPICPHFSPTAAFLLCSPAADVKQRKKQGS